MFKQNILLSKPILNAAGTLGFTPDPRGPIALSMLGAFITNPVSLAPRNPAKTSRMINFPGGVLLHTGLPNPGYRKVSRTYTKHWLRSSIPIIVHLFADDPAHIQIMMTHLEEVEGVTGIELGLSSRISLEELKLYLDASTGELPVIIRFPLDQALELAKEAYNAGFHISLGPPRGTLVDKRGNYISGRLYGPALFPLALETVRSLGSLKIPVIAGSGVYTLEQAKMLLDAGASAVQLDTVLWKQNLNDNNFAIT